MIDKVVVFDKNTREVLACIPLDGSDAVMKKDIDMRIFIGSEPVFEQGDGTILLKDDLGNGQGEI